MPHVSDILLRYLASSDVRHLFLIPGDDPHLNLAADTYCQPVVMRDERAAAFAAQIYGRLKGLGACMSSHGPGMTNLVTGLAAAFLEHDPVIAICSQLPTSCCNNQTHAYISEEVLLPVTKGISRVVDSNSVLAVTRSLLQLACASPFGPVALILPQDISASTPTSSTPFSDEYRTRMDAEKTGREVSPSLSHALRRLNEAKRILLVVGAGVVRADVTEQVRSLAHKTGAYCTTTLQSKGSFYPLREITVSRHNLEALLCHIHYDLCLVIGVDSAEGLIGLPSGERVLFVNEFPDETFRGEQISGPLSESIEFLETACDIKTPQSWDVPLTREPSHILERCALESSRFDGIICIDTGLYKHTWATFGIARGPNRQIFSNGLSSIGWSLAAAIGAHYASGERVLAVIGDGGFSMAASELFPILQYDLPISVLIVQDNAYGMIMRHDLEILGKHSDSVLIRNCDDTALAAAFDFEFQEVSSENVDDCFAWTGRRRMFRLRVDYSTYDFSFHQAKCGRLVHLL